MGFLFCRHIKMEEQIKFLKCRHISTLGGAAAWKLWSKPVLPTDIFIHYFPVHLGLDCVCRARVAIRARPGWQTGAVADDWALTGVQRAVPAYLI